MNRGDIGENYVAVHYDNDYTCRIFLYYYYSSRMTTVIAIQSLRNMAGIKRQKQNSTITEIQIVYRYRGKCRETDWEEKVLKWLLIIALLWLFG